MVEEVVFDMWPFSSDRLLLEKHFRGAGNHNYCIDSSHTETSFTREDGKSGIILVGTPYKCSDYVDRMQILKNDYAARGRRTSPESIKGGVAGFFWVAPRGRT